MFAVCKKRESEKFAISTKSQIGGEKRAKKAATTLCAKLKCFWHFLSSLHEDLMLPSDIWKFRIYFLFHSLCCGSSNKKLDTIGVTTRNFLVLKYDY